MRLSERYYAAMLSGDKIEQQRVLDAMNQKYGAKTPAKSDTWLFSPVLTNAKTPCLKLKEILDKQYGEEWAEWMPETLDKTIFMDFNTIMNQAVREKILAMKMCININYAWHEWSVFQKVVLALNGIYPNIEMVEDPSLSQVIKAIPVMQSLRPGEQFDDNVKKYIAVLCKSEHLIIPPPQLEDLCGEFVGRLTQPENIQHVNAIKTRLLKLIEKRDSEALEEDNVIDIQAKRLYRIMQAAQIPS